MYSSQGDNPNNRENIMALPVIDKATSDRIEALPVIDKATSDRIEALLELARENRIRMNKLIGKEGYGRQYEQ